jgi:hypothetical protein
LYRESRAVFVVGLDGHGSPIVRTFKSVKGIGDEPPDELLVVTGPNISRAVATGPIADSLPTAVDAHGVWFAAVDGIYLLPDGGSLGKVSGVIATPAGGCE